MTTTKWNANLYDNKHQFVSAFGEALLDFLPNIPHATLLDVGCGTGDLAQALYERGYTVTGFDASEEMIAQAKQKYPHIQFEVANATTFESTVQYDIVFSNAALHWIKDAQAVANVMYAALKPDGTLLVEFGGFKNCKQMVDAVRTAREQLEFGWDESYIPWYFPTIGQYTNVLESAGFEVSWAQRFARPTPLEGEDGMANWYRMFGEALFTALNETEKERTIAHAVEQLRPSMYVDGEWTADYVRLRTLARKPV
ncbi:MAG: class I SAM-dependent methyltransferase [Bacilli bacterium]